MYCPTHSRLSRICKLLSSWIEKYPTDFAVPGTEGALSALVKSILGKTYLLHYGSEFIPFLEKLSTLKDEDSTWALKAEETREDSDDCVSFKEPVDTTSSRRSLRSEETGPVEKPKTAPRERKHSLPLSARILVMESGQSLANPFLGAADSIDHPPARKLKILVQYSNTFINTDPTSVAQELSRFECRFFMQIKVSQLDHIFSIVALTLRTASALAPARTWWRKQESGDGYGHSIQRYFKSYRGMVLRLR